MFCPSRNNYLNSKEMNILIYTKTEVAIYKWELQFNLVINTCAALGSGSRFVGFMGNAIM